MSNAPDLLFRRLEETDMELAMAVAASCFGLNDPGSECFGLTPDGPPEAGGEPWGVFERGVLAGIGWLLPERNGIAEIAGVALPRKRWGMGFLIWMMDEWSGKGVSGAARELAVKIAEGGPGLGEALTDAGFIGPDPEDDDYPHGEWRRLAMHEA